MQRKGSVVALAGFVVVATVSALTVRADLQADLGIQLIPQPAELKRLDGRFEFDAQTEIVTHPDTRAVALLLRDQLRATLPYSLDISLERADENARNTVALRLDDTLAELGPEGYRLDVTPAAISIRAVNRAGLFYGGQTLRQLLPMQRVIGLPAHRISWTVPCVSISDSPRFRWRGLMLDCSRTFQSPDYIRATIDRMAMYKMNVLHLHLTDDQGWRMEIKAHPDLTRHGARFPDRWQEPPAHQGFYSQEQMRELVGYAQARNVTIVPEIEMPGHALAALACFPELSCRSEPLEIHPFFEGPGIHEDIFCAGKDETFEFLQDVLSEVMEVFPSKTIHIGGDEAPKERWRECPRCQERIQREGLQDEHELQSYFIRRIERYVNSRGRQIIGWDEILEGGLAPNAAVMSWRGTEGGIAAARDGHEVVMSPTSHCYFDYDYERIDTRRVYEFEPVPDQLTEQQAGHVRGLQANFWSHIDREPGRVDHQLFPRLLAIAERGWSPREVRDWKAFRWRVNVHLVHLDAMQANYRRPPMVEPPFPVGRWSPQDVGESYRDVFWDVTEQVTGPGQYRFRLQYTHGAHRLGVEEVTLLACGIPVAIDHHRGVTGIIHDGNEYLLTVATHHPGVSYSLRASVRSEGGTDSNGQVYLIKE